MSLKPFREVDAQDLESYSLREEMDAHGYVLVRNALPQEDVERMLAEIAEVIVAAGWLLPELSPLELMANPAAACGDDDPAYKPVYEQIFRLESFHAFPHHAALRELMTRLAGPRLLVHPKSAARLIFPNEERFVTQAHQDHTSVSGDAESFTAWMPLHDCPLEQGSLQVLEGSHRFGQQETLPGWGTIPKGSERGGDWVGGRINAGDVLIFHSLTVHAAAANTSAQMRVSMDCRFQSYERAVNPGVLVFPGASNKKSWETVYAGWESDALQYYWKRFPLQFRPSKAELAELAKHAETEEMRARYGRILSRLELQIPG